MTRPLCVLIIGPLPPPSGGMANQTRQMRNLLQVEGVQVLIVQSNAPYRPSWAGRLRGVRAFFRIVPFVLAVFRETRRADVVHVMANSGWAWRLVAAPAIRIAKRRGKPVIVNYRGGLAREFLASNAGGVRRTLQRADALVVPSRFLHEVFAAYGMDATVVPNVVDVDVFRPAVAGRADTGIGPHVVVARNLEKIYGIDTAIRALGQLRCKLPGATLSIAGTGPEEGNLRGLVEVLGLEAAVRFTGRLEVPEMAALYRDADVVLNPSRADNTPNSILEALACGVPVVSTNVGGVPYLVEHERTAWLVPPDEPAEMAAGIEMVSEDFELRRRLIANGLQLARQCSWPVVRNEWLGLYRRLVAFAKDSHRGPVAVR